MTSTVAVPKGRRKGRPNPAVSTAVYLLTSSPKGGVGKTSLSRNIAVAAASEGLKVATLDLDPQGTLTKWWGRRPEERVVQFEHYRADITSDFEAVLTQAGADGQLVLIDTPTSVENHVEAMKSLILASAFVLIPTGPQFDDRDSVKPWMRMVRDYGAPAAFVLNRVKKKSKALEAAKVDLIREGKLCPIEIPDLEDIHKFTDSGLTAIDVGGANGAEEFIGVWNFVKNELGM